MTLGDAVNPPGPAGVGWWCSPRCRGAPWCSGHGRGSPWVSLPLPTGRPRLQGLLHRQRGGNCSPLQLNFGGAVGGTAWRAQTRHFLPSWHRVL